MTTKPDKQLVQYSEALMVLSIFSATFFGISNLFPICYELGKDASDTFIWFALVQGIKAYAMFFIAVLTYFLARNVRKGIVFSPINQRILFAIGGSTVISGAIINAIINCSSLEMPTDTSLLLIIIGLFIVLMKPKSNYTRVMAGFYIFLCLIASMIVGELIYFLAIVPLVPKQTWLPLMNVAWVYLVVAIYYKLTRRYTKWWKKLENKQ